MSENITLSLPTGNEATYDLHGVMGRGEGAFFVSSLSSDEDEGIVTIDLTNLYGLSTGTPTVYVIGLEDPAQADGNVSLPREEYSGLEPWEEFDLRGAVYEEHQGITINTDGTIDLERGGHGDDFLNGGGSADTLFGGADRDTFEFRNGFGDDTIHDFEANEAILFVNVAASDISDLTITQSGTTTTIEIDGNQISVLNFGMTDLSADNFTFA